MEETFRIIYQGGTGQIVEKKSRFIADIIPVSSEAEALEFIESLRKKYWDARHHCYAYVIGEHHECTRCSDDGEPAQTAGRPMLDVLLSQNLHNTVVVVTRYFGGTLLGTGGLVRAYSAAVKEGLSHCMILTRQECVRLEIQSDYNSIGKLQYLAATMNIYLQESQYTEQVRTIWILEKDQAEGFVKKVLEMTNGQAVLSDPEPCYAAWQGKEMVLLSG